ncbi:hypothetical protein ANN_03037 [Periplaneta americana]|uniref:Per a allergen n=1 Tax=Periplaneta americana TaxID=6978 RepID=A0ABQ8TZ42_PERAM|nr:hypothetical protein ANN_03037 [Periplaneta americana]
MTTLRYVDHMWRLRGRQKIGKLENAGFAVKDLPMGRTLITSIERYSARVPKPQHFEISDFCTKVVQTDYLVLIAELRKREEVIGGEGRVPE